MGCAHICIFLCHLGWCPQCLCRPLQQLLVVPPGNGDGARGVACWLLPVTLPVVWEPQRVGARGLTWPGPPILQGCWRERRCHSMNV